MKDKQEMIMHVRKWIARLFVMLIAPMIFYASCSKEKARQNSLVLQVTHIPNANVRKHWYEFTLLRDGEAVVRKFDLSKKGNQYVSFDLSPHDSNQVLDLFGQISKADPPEGLSLMGASSTRIEIHSEADGVQSFVVPNPSNGLLSWGQLEGSYSGQDHAKDRERKEFLDKLRALRDCFEGDLESKKIEDTQTIKN